MVPPLNVVVCSDGKHVDGPAAGRPGCGCGDGVQEKTHRFVELPRLCSVSLCGARYTASQGFCLVVSSGVALEWFKSYLSCRSQFVQYDGYSSSSKYIKCGVPQGSILGPLLLLLYINDLCDASKALDFILFADDTNIFYSHKDQNYLMEIVNTELKKLSSWFQANKLSINIKKSNFILFKTKQNRRKLDLHF